MKQLLFHYLGFPYTNIGDYIQSLAAKQFLKSRVDIIYCQRDELNDFTQEDVYAIMNGWYLHKKENWPPSPLITPLFVSVHFNVAAYDTLLSENSIRYLKTHQPIGCRDLKTVEVLKEKGVDAFFSSCLTTTLGYKYRVSPAKKRNGIYIVDPVHYVPETNRRLMKYRLLFYYLLYYRGIKDYINNLLRNNIYNVTWQKNKIGVICQATRAYMLLIRILGKENLKKATVLTQYHCSEEYPSNEGRFARAEELIKLYASAELVITSRIHCALPCLGLGTPVIFLQNLDDSTESDCRFGGLLEFLNVIKFRKNRIIHTPLNIPIDVKNISNKDTYKQYADRLIKTCNDFVNSFSE